MEELKLVVSIYSLLVTSFISLLTIFVNIRLTRLSISNNKKMKIYDQHKEALVKYYLPVKFELIRLECMLRENDIYFDMFCQYSNDVQKQRKRGDALCYYNEFINKFRTSSLYFTNDKIDKLISKVYEHMLVIVLDNKKILSASKYKEKYDMPNLESIIEMIDEYSNEYETVSQFNWYWKVKKFFQKRQNSKR